MKRSTYRKFNIKNIQLSTRINITDIQIVRTFLFIKLKTQVLEFLFLINGLLTIIKTFQKNIKINSLTQVYFQFYMR